MRISSHTYQLDIEKADQLINDYMKKFDDVCYGRRQLNRSSIIKFLAFLREYSKQNKGQLLLTGNHIMNWMTHIAKDMVVMSVVQRLSAVEGFLETLAEAEIISANAMADFKAHFPRRGWTGIAQALKSKNPKSYLASLRVEPKFSGSFGEQARTYLEVHRASGIQIRSVESTLIGFNRFLRACSITSFRSITSDIVMRWIQSMTCSRNHRRTKVLELNRFFRYLSTLRIIKTSPITAATIKDFGSVDRSFRPYIFTHGQITAILHESHKLASNHKFAIKAETLHTIIVLLYTLGLRHGEALRLCIRDVNIDQRTILIRGTKFYKDRIVPFGHRLEQCLEDYLRKRRTIFTPVRSDDPLFVAMRRTAVCSVQIRRIFGHIMKRAGITLKPSQRRPRIHDLRHTFAVHRLLRWYEEGADVQSKLPLLSTFMGHSNIYSTQRYLTITGSLLNEANKLFYRQFGTLFEREESL